MSYGNIKTFPVALVASGASTSSNIPMGGRAWSKAGVVVGTMSTAMQFMVQNSADGSNFFYVYNRSINSATIATVTFSVTGLANGGFVPLPNDTPYGVIRFVLTGVVSGGCSFTVIAAD